jgi:hypothetical protein
MKCSDRHHINGIAYSLEVVFLQFQPVTGPLCRLIGVAQSLHNQTFRASFHSFIQEPLLAACEDKEALKIVLKSQPTQEFWLKGHDMAHSLHFYDVHDMPA